MMFGPLTAPIAKPIDEFYSGLKFDLPLSDGWPAPSEHGFGKTLTTSTKQRYNLRLISSASTPPKDLSGAFPYIVILYIIVFLLSLKLVFLYYNSHFIATLFWEILFFLRP